MASRTALWPLFVLDRSESLATGAASSWAATRGRVFLMLRFGALWALPWSPPIVWELSREQSSFHTATAALGLGYTLGVAHLYSSSVDEKPS